MFLRHRDVVLGRHRLVSSPLVVARHRRYLVVTYLTTGHLHEQRVQTLVVGGLRRVGLHEVVLLALGQLLQALHDHRDVGDRVLVTDFGGGPRKVAQKLVVGLI